MKQICLFNINQDDIFDKFQHDVESSDEEQDKSALLSREEQINKNI
jgi:hypothetical protein